MEFSLFATSKTCLPSGSHCKCAAQSVRALPIRILTVGKKRSAGIQLIADEYIEKLKHYCPVEDVRIKSNPRNARDTAAQVEHEDMAVMGLIKANEWVVMLDERGLNLGSEQMASLIADAGNTGASSILFCIGGPYGHGRQLRERADVSIRLSSLVLNHEIALGLDYSQRPEVSSLDIILDIHHDLSRNVQDEQKVVLTQFLIGVILVHVGMALVLFSTFAASVVPYEIILILRQNGGRSFFHSVWLSDVKQTKERPTAVVRRL
ncbi:methyltransferase [Perilla frutescens var. hirtella]|uniref:Methyltransferase n=1 Tax=Perilla frutescens var. hirtella TaxID=608512 RepID=A0AAD4JMW8_PERFH|nr:methyltransferase [Perilla frutescens var. hirtella]KAH6836376.1 methyltransferase [Perilla frutescens var. hirtella]